MRNRVLLLAILLTACSTPAEPDQAATLRVAITDRSGLLPGAVDSAIVTVRSVTAIRDTIHPGDVLESEPHRYDLMRLQSGATRDIAERHIRPGRVLAVQLEVEDPALRVYLADGRRYAVRPQASHLLMMVDTDVRTGDRLTVTCPLVLRWEATQGFTLLAGEAP